jgi:hypothetical protein
MPRLKSRYMAAPLSVAACRASVGAVVEVLTRSETSCRLHPDSMSGGCVNPFTTTSSSLSARIRSRIFSFARLWKSVRAGAPKDSK